MTPPVDSRDIFFARHCASPFLPLPFFHTRRLSRSSSDPLLFRDTGGFLPPAISVRFGHSPVALPANSSNLSPSVHPTFFRDRRLFSVPVGFYEVQRAFSPGKKYSQHPKIFLSLPYRVRFLDFYLLFFWNPEWFRSIKVCFSYFSQHTSFVSIVCMISHSWIGFLDYLPRAIWFNPLTSPLSQHLLYPQP